MKILKQSGWFAALVLVLCSAAAVADKDKFEETIQLFRDAGDSAGYFNSAYGYAVFPTIGKAGFGIGGARGAGREEEEEETRTGRPTQTRGRLLRGFSGCPYRVG